MKKPGLFITGTDTSVGKTVITCAIAAAMRAVRPGARIGVCKPIATGCRPVRDGLISDDAEALARFSGCRSAMEVINPVRYLEPVAPAVAAELAGRPIDWGAIAGSLAEIDSQHDAVVVEGVGGIMVPLDRKRTVLDLMCDVGYPVIVVTRPNLGTLNHTAMTCRLIRAAGLRLAGILINRFDASTVDLAEKTNPAWIAAQNEADILAIVPNAGDGAAELKDLSPNVLVAMAGADWWKICQIRTLPEDAE